jgi:hypothetical protein
VLITPSAWGSQLTGYNHHHQLHASHQLIHSSPSSLPPGLAPTLELCQQVEGNLLCRTPSRCRISSLNPPSSAAARTEPEQRLYTVCVIPRRCRSCGTCRCAGVVALVSWCRGAVTLWSYGAMLMWCWSSSTGTTTRP